MATLATYVMANLSPMSNYPTPDIDNRIEYVLVERKRLSHVYDAFLYMTAEHCKYTVWLASKNDKGKIVGWQNLPFKLARKIFPDLKHRKNEYTTECEEYF